MIIFRARDVRFGLDHRAGLLIRGDRRIDLPRQQYELLQYLLQNRPGELITREELLDHVWKGRSVNEEALTRALHRLRGVLGDNDREGLGFIETVRGRGVRFAGVIETDTRSDLQARKGATSAPSDVNHDLAGRRAGLEPAFRTSGHIPVFYVESLSRWPYEGIQSKAEYEIGTPIDPHFQWYEMGEPPTGEAIYAFASSASSLRYINEHTIPAGVDYQLVLASVIDLRTYTEPPRYSDLFANFERLEEWFLGNGGRPGRRG